MSLIKIKAVENNTAHTPLKNTDIVLQDVYRKQCLISTSNDEGIAEFEVNGWDIFRIYKVSLSKEINHRTSPECDRILITFNAIDEIQELRFQRYTDVFRVNLYSEIGRYYFQKKDKINFKAYYPDSIKEEDIKWAYTFISKKLELKEALKGKKLKQGDEKEFKESPARCLNNAKYYMLKDKNQVPYKGKEVEDYEINNVINDSKMIVFAYTKEPLEDVYTEIVLGDIIQISIDCSMQEALKAQDEVCKLGWTTSYVLQRLWHDNPKCADKINQLKYKNSEDLLPSIENEEMKNLISKYAPNIELKPFEIKQLNLKQGVDPCYFYVELDWEEFYFKFPLIQEIKKELFEIKSVIQRLSHSYGQIVTYTYNNSNPHLTDNLLKDITQKLFNQARLCRNTSTKGCFNDTGVIDTKKELNALIILDKDKKELELIVNIENIKRGRTETELVFSVYPKDKSLFIYNDNYKKISELKPADIDKAAMQTGLGLSDVDFGIEFTKGIIDKIKEQQTLALYACTGKFSIYYIPAKFLLKKENNKSYVYIKELYAYVWDTFDFDDEWHDYIKGKEHTDENIEKLGQPVGTWNYKELSFDFDNSVRQMRTYILPFPKKYINLHLYILSSFFPSLNQDTFFNGNEIKELKQNQIYPLYNQDYQNYKKEFNKGTNFRIFSKDKINDKIHKGFYVLKVPEDKITQEYFRVEL